MSYAPAAMKSLPTIALATSLLVGLVPTQSHAADEEYVRHTELGMNLGVMIWNDVDRDIVKPGAALTARLGFDFKYFVPQMEFGLRWTAIDPSKLDPLLQRDPLRSIVFALGSRFQVPNQSRVTPYADVMFDMNWWNYREVSNPSCVSYYCNSVAKYRFTPGFRGRLGMLIRATDLFEVELGFGAAFSFRGSFFIQNRSWLEPYVGFTYSFKSRQAYSIRP